MVFHCVPVDYLICPVRARWIAVIDCENSLIRSRIRSLEGVQNGPAPRTWRRKPQACWAQPRRILRRFDLIVLASVTPDMFFPATACLYRNALARGRRGLLTVRRALASLRADGGAQFVGTGTTESSSIGSDTMTSVLD